MLLLFQVCFFVGVGLTLVSLVLGNLFHLEGLDGVDGLDLEVDLDLDLDGGGALFPLSPMLCVIFLTIFGGSGLILLQTNLFTPDIIVIVAVAISFFISYLIQKYIMMPLKKAQNTSAPSLDELIGVTAKVNEKISKNGYGEIIYIVNGNTFSAPAKSVEDEEILVGASVSICFIQDHVFYVTPFNQ